MVSPHWPQLGCGAIVRRGDAVLLVKRGRPPREGQWAIPGGKVRAGEGLREAAEREILEETGIRIRAAEMVYQLEYIEHDNNGELAFHYVVLDFAGEYLGGELHAGDDADEHETPCRLCVDIPLSPGIADGPGVQKIPVMNALSAGFAPSIPDMDYHGPEAFAAAGVCPAFTSFYTPLSSIILIV